MNHSRQSFPFKEICWERLLMGIKMPHQSYRLEVKGMIGNDRERLGTNLCKSGNLKGILTMQPNHTLQQTADSLGVPIETLMAFLQSASKVIADAERIKTCQLIVSLPRIME